MRVILQRSKRATVTVEGHVTGAIDSGYVLLVGITHEDTEKDADYCARKIAQMRLFEDEDGKMNRSCAEADGEVLCVSQFTLYGEVRRGNRPSFDSAAPGAIAEPLYEAFCVELERLGIRCSRGVFGAEMAVHLVNDGPVTLILDTAELERPRRA